MAEEIAACRKVGLPVESKDLQRPLPPDEVNAATIYRQLEALLKRRPLSKADEEKIGQLASRKMASEADVQAARNALANRQDIGKLIHLAASRPQCVVRRDWSLGPSLLFPDFARMRLAARWLSAESHIQLADGKPQDAVRTLAFGFRIARHAASDPVILAMLVSAAVNAITMAGLDHVLYTTGSDPAVADAVRVMVDREWHGASLRHAFGGEIVTARVSTEILRKQGLAFLRASSGGESLPRSAGPEPELPKALVDANGATLLHYLRRIAVIADRPFPEVKSAPITGEIERLGENERDTNKILAVIIVPAFGQIAWKRASDTARKDILRSAAALLSFKSRNGRLPERLEEAISPVPLDPFDLKPLKYRTEGDGFVIFSVGPTGEFQGGDPPEKPPAQEALFRWPLPAYLR